MVPTIRPVSRALVPVDSDTAQRVSAPNYDEFQSDDEVRERIRLAPESILRVTLPHCDLPAGTPQARENSDAALSHARDALDELAAGPNLRAVDDILWVYAIDGEHGRQIGLGGMASTAEIRTEENPAGVVVRNEQIREEKARGRARLIRATGCAIGLVNHAVEDRAGELERCLLEVAAAAAPDFEVRDEGGRLHRTWLVTGAQRQAPLVAALAAEREAYVADGNHRSAAAVELGLPGYPGVFFCLRGMGILAYHRLVRAERSLDELVSELESDFEVEPLTGDTPFEPIEVHDVGLYSRGRWFRLAARPGSFDTADAARAVDADIVQRNLLAVRLGIDDPKDARLTFVGGDRPLAELVERVDSGEFTLALVLAPVPREQFVAVCRQHRFMPPKSTWFDPKVRSGLVIPSIEELRPPADATVPAGRGGGVA